MFRSLDEGHLHPLQISSVTYMALPNEAIEEFKQIHFEEFGVKLGDNEAEELANSVFELLTSLLTKNKT